MLSFISSKLSAGLDQTSILTALSTNMKHRSHIGAFILAIAGLMVAQGPGEGRPHSDPSGSADNIPPDMVSIITITTTLKNSYLTTPAPIVVPSIVTGVSSTGQVPVTTSAPGGTGSNGGGNGVGVFTVSIVNSYSVALSLSFESNSGAPTPIGNPQPTTIGKAATTFYSYPQGWAGRIYVGKENKAANTKFEGSVTGPPDQDVSVGSIPRASLSPLQRYKSPEKFLRVFTLRGCLLARSAHSKTAR